MRLQILLILALFSNMAKAQIWAGLYTGYSVTTINPPEKFGLDQSSRIDSSSGWDYALSFSTELSDKMRFLMRFSYNQQSAYVYHRYMEAQNLENQTDGRMSSQYLGLYLAPIWHKGQRLEFVYGLGFYAGFKASTSFTGVYRIVDNGKTETYKAVNAPAETYRNLATGLFTSIGFNYNISPKIQVGLNADLVLFLNAKNIIFQDTGSTNEISMRFGFAYLFEKKEEG